jgi:hypothetical protein
VIREEAAISTGSFGLMGDFGEQARIAGVTEIQDRESVPHRFPLLAAQRIGVQRPAAVLTESDLPQKYAPRWQ